MSQKQPERMTKNQLKKEITEIYNINMENINELT